MPPLPTELFQIVCEHVHTHTQHFSNRLEEGVVGSGAGAIGSHELPDVGAENRIGVLCKSSKCHLSSPRLVLFPSLPSFLFYSVF